MSNQAAPQVKDQQSKQTKATLSKPQEQQSLIALTGVLSKHALIDTDYPSPVWSGLNAEQRSQMVLQLQGTHGNLHTQRLLQHKGHVASVLQRKAFPEEAVREQIENTTGYDLAHVQVTQSSPLAAATEVEALTVGNQVHIAPGHYQPETTYGAHLLRHEFAHVVQQGKGETKDIAENRRYESLEEQANQLSQRSERNSPVNSRLNPLATPSHPVVQAFDPRYHRQSTVQGLVGSGFSNEEIGQIYAANWERDFSQAHPALGNIVLAWKSVKIAASRSEPLNPKIEAFDNAVGVVIDMVPFRISELMNEEAYGGYRYYEHMDNPGADAAVTAGTKQGEQNRKDLLRVPPGEKIPQYMVDSREYIKTQLYYAAHAYRGDMENANSAKTAGVFGQRMAELAQNVPAGKAAPGGLKATSVAAEASAQAMAIPVSILNFEDEVATAQPSVGGVHPNGSENALRGAAFNQAVDQRFWAQTRYKVGKRLDPNLPEDKPYVQIWLRIRDQIRAEQRTVNNQQHNGSSPVLPEPARQQQINGQAPVQPVGKWSPQVADAMGRAGHSLEDFFAHSNFVELAIGEPASTVVANEQGALTTSNQLGTGTFGKNDKLHSLTHKIRAVADEIESEMPLVNRVTGRTSENPQPNQVHIGNEASPAQEHEEPKDWLEALGGTGLNTITTIAGYTYAGYKTMGLYGAIMGLRRGIKVAARDIIATPQGVKMLRRVAELLEEQTRKDAAVGSHTALAKDQPGHEDSPLGVLRTIKFELAQELAAAADRTILAEMRKVFDAPSPESADTQLQEIYNTLNLLIAPPSGHILEPLIDRRREEAEKALEAYQGHSRPGDFPPPERDRSMA